MIVYSPEKINKELAVIMPAYNEEETIADTVNEWSEVAMKCNGILAVINDGSTDDTLDILKSKICEYPNLVVIDKPNSGHGPSCVEGYLWVVENSFNWIFQTDSDGQTKGDEFLTVWKNKDNHDFIFGFRSKREDGFGRMVISKVLQFIILVIFDVFVKDANVPFRLMKTKTLAPFLNKIEPDMFLANALLTAIIKKYSSIKWVEISFLPRKGGTPSVSWMRFINVGLKVSRQFHKARHRI